MGKLMLGISSHFAFSFCLSLILNVDGDDDHGDDDDDSINNDDNNNSNNNNNNNNNCVRGTRTQPLICVVREVFSRLHFRRRHTFASL